MADFFTLSCPSCGGKLEITNDIERFACEYCGNEHLVRRSGGIVSLTPVVEGLKRVQSGVDKTASELAISRIKEEIAELERRKDAIRPPETLRIVTIGTFSVGILGLVSGATILRSVLSDSVAITTICVGLLIIFTGVIAGALAGSSVRKRRVPYEKEILKKKQELAKHQATVSE